MRTLPRAGVQTPTSRRASDDFPDAVGPITPSALPAVSEKFTSWHTSFCSPGGATAAFCTTSVFAGGCSAIGAPCAGLREEVRKPVPALPGGDETAPVGDGEIDRRQ